MTVDRSAPFEAIKTRAHGLEGLETKLEKETIREFWLTSSDAPARRLQDETNVHAEARQHVNQAISTEQIDSPTQEITDAGLGDAQDSGSLRLGQSARRERLLELNQQVGADQEMLGFF